MSSEVDRVGQGHGAQVGLLGYPGIAVLEHGFEPVPPGRGGRKTAGCPGQGGRGDSGRSDRRGRFNVAGTALWMRILMTAQPGRDAKCGGHQEGKSAQDHLAGPLGRTIGSAQSEPIDGDIAPDCNRHFQGSQVGSNHSTRDNCLPQRITRRTSRRGARDVSPRRKSCFTVRRCRRPSRGYPA